jgi:LuxR family transcriptional regulator, quorum-sensing system regulator BjaR1
VRVEHHLAAPDPLRFYTDLQVQTSVAACSDLFRDAVARFDIVAFAYGEIDLADRARNVMFIVEWPKAWIDYYVKSGFIEQDPIVNALKVYRKAFSFGDIIRDRRFSRLDREALRVGVEYGWSRGLAVPVARGGERFGLVTMMGPGDELDPTQRAYLCLISECLLARIRSLGECIEFALPPAGMTRREIEAARLVALGCSDAEIALKLGVSEPTAHKHVESGRNRLKARSRAHMAGLCLSLGIASAA